MKRNLLLLVIGLLLIGAFLIPMSAAWQNNGNLVCTNTGIQEWPAICEDSAGGAIIAWQDSRDGNKDIYAQRIDSAGQIRWDPSGIPICNDIAGQQEIQMCSDGAGGAIITWRDFRSGNSDVYAQRIDANGHVRWLTNGIPIGNATGGNNAQNSQQICSDSNGGFIIVWEDGRNGANNIDLYAQRISINGVLAWDKYGTLVSSGPLNDRSAKIISDGLGGAIITWGTSSSEDGPEDIYVQKLNSTGDRQWGVNASVVCNESHSQYTPALCSDGAGGAIIIWIDYRNLNLDIYGQRISSANIPPWTANGIAICNQTDTQTPVSIVSDDAGGAIACWADYRSEVGYDLYAQRVTQDGEPHPDWTFNGEVICNTHGVLSFQLCRDGAGGAVIVWDDFVNASKVNIYAQRISSKGESLWQFNGRAICRNNHIAQAPQLVNTGGTIIFTWLDDRSDPNLDIYAFGISLQGSNIGLIILLVLIIPIIGVCLAIFIRYKKPELFQ